MKETLYYVGSATVASITLLFLCLSQPRFGPIHQAISFLRPQICQPPEHTLALQNLVSSACMALNTAGVEYWLDGDTLLAAVRDGVITPQDVEASIGYLAVDMHRVLSVLGSRYKIRMNYMGMGSPTVPGGGNTLVAEADLRRYDISPTGTIERSLAEHEDNVVDKSIAWYNSYPLSSAVLPARYLGGLGPLAHCKVPVDTDEVLRRSHGPRWMDRVDCTPAESQDTLQKQQQQQGAQVLTNVVPPSQQPPAPYYPASPQGYVAHQSFLPPPQQYPNQRPNFPQGPHYPQPNSHHAYVPVHVPRN